MRAARAALGVREDQLLILTVGGDAASKGGREVMRALASLGDQIPDYRYVCKVWAQARTEKQNALDLALAEELGIQQQVLFCDGRVSRPFMPFLLSACDVYAAPSRLEGFGMGQVEAGACGKPVIGIRAMAMLETLVHGQTALLASVATENVATGATVGPEAGFEPGHRIEFANPRVVDYRASVPDLAEHLRTLLNDPSVAPSAGRSGTGACPRVRLSQGRAALHRHRATQARLGGTMNQPMSGDVEAARRAAIAVLEHNAFGAVR